MTSPCSPAVGTNGEQKMATKDQFFIIVLLPLPEVKRVQHIPSEPLVFPLLGTPREIAASNRRTFGGDPMRASLTATKVRVKLIVDIIGLPSSRNGSPSA